MTTTEEISFFIVVTSLFLLFLGFFLPTFIVSLLLKNVNISREYIHIISVKIIIFKEVVHKKFTFLGRKNRELFTLKKRKKFPKED